jgi:hypothetical protein
VILLPLLLAALAYLALAIATPIVLHFDTTRRPR